MLSVMEPMNVTLISVFNKEGNVRARARAVAHDVEIMVEVRFQADEGASKAELWLEARDQCLRYLDVA